MNGGPAPISSRVRDHLQGVRRAAMISKEPDDVERPNDR